MIKAIKTTLLFMFALPIFLFAGLNSSESVDIFSQFPVLHNGRIKPMDSVARNLLLVCSEKQTLSYNNERIAASDYLLTLFTNPQLADSIPLFKVKHPDLKTTLKLNENQKLFSYKDIFKHVHLLSKQASHAQRMERKLQNPYERELSDLYKKIIMVHQLKSALFFEHTHSFEHHIHTIHSLAHTNKELMTSHTQTPSTLSQENKKSLKKINRWMKRFSHAVHQSPLGIIPNPNDSNDTHWNPISKSLYNCFMGQALHTLTVSYARFFDAVKNNKPSSHLGKEILEHYKHTTPGSIKKTKYEVLFNTLQPFYLGIILFVLGFLLVILSYLKYEHILKKTAQIVITLGFVSQSVGILSRMILQGRPPVTNLYSSAIFVGWGSVGVCLLLFILFKDKLLLAITSVLGLLSLLIAHHLSLSGDTLEMMQAVLDSNFWLATHVITITIGYSGTFLAGGLGATFIIKQFLGIPSNDKKQLNLFKMAFGIVCFALLLSFVGTVLGGIWADQSWGRFWGWDPKENGALLIVIWNALMLHLRLNGTIKQSGFMIATIFGNIVTAFSWFGVNMLGIGLHSYGFMEKSFYWLIYFSLSQLILMGLGFLPPLKPKASH